MKVFLSAGFMALLLLTQSFSALATTRSAAPLIRAQEALSGHYIVVLKGQADLKNLSDYRKNLAVSQQELMRIKSMVGALGGQIIEVYTYALYGFHVTLNPNAVETLRQDDSIKYIEEVGIIRLDDEWNPEVLNTLDVRSWGIDRVDQRALPLNGTYDVFYRGEGTHAYILDTGVSPTHQEFTGRMGNGISTVPGDSSTQDCHGHGTHVAGTVAGTTTGLATKAMIHPVRVLGCGGSGSIADIVSAIDWVIGNHSSPAVINMSLGGGYSQALNDGVASAVKAGVTTVVAAGNSNFDACRFSPASEPTVITVGASDANDVRASFSNWGTCLDIWAPGVNITSAGKSSNDGYTAMSGTSMASPHVAGGALLYLGLNPKASPAEVVTALQQSATPNLPSNPNGSSQNMLYVKEFKGTSLFVDAGADIFQRMPNNTVVIHGGIVSASGTINSITWEQISGPVMKNLNVLEGASAVLTLRDLSPGNYEFLLRATDSSGATSQDSVKVSIAMGENIQPKAVIVANSQKVNPKGFLNLDGTASSDSDGIVAGHKWETVSGPGNLKFESPTQAITRVTGAVAGDYTVKLTVTDNEGAQNSSEMNFRINSAPVVSLAPDYFVEYPNQSVVLKANVTDVDSSMIQYHWEGDPSNPKPVNWSSMNSPEVTVSEMTLPGVYKFTFTATDEMDLVSTGTTVVTVRGKPPVVTVGNDLNLVAPVKEVQLKGVCTTDQGACLSMKWTKISGPTAAEIIPIQLNSVRESVLVLSNLGVGQYVYEFTGVADTGGVASARMTVTVR